MKRKPNQRGFTLIESLVVIMIVGILVALAHSALRLAREDARTVKEDVTLARVDEAKIRYYLDTKDEGEPSLATLATYIEQGAYGGAEIFYTKAAWERDNGSDPDAGKLLGGVKGFKVIKPNTRQVPATLIDF